MTLSQPRRPDSPPETGSRAWPDAVAVITVYLLVLLAVPADRRVEVLGGAGAPAGLLAILALLWWGWYRVQGWRSEGRPFHPVSAALLLFVITVLASYVVSSTMALPATERSAADMGVLRLAAMAGILLIAADGVSTRDRFLVLMRRMSMFGGLYATLGLLQFFTGQSFVNSWSIPGLGVSGSISFGERAGFIRAISTAMHPLEAAVILAMILPIALTVAIYDRGSRFARWYPVAAIVLLSVLSVSRSALVGVAVVFAVLIWTWPKAVRHAMGVAIAFGLVAVYVGVPGMAGTVIGMFSEPDTSISSRTDSYDTAIAFVEVSPLFGRGLGTFLPSYRILDNQFLLTLVETGIFGLLGLIALILSACWAAVSMRRVWGTRDQMGAFGYALLASVLAGSLLLAFFDAFSFSQACGIFFLVIGLCGAYLNLCRAKAAPSHAPAQEPPHSLLRRRWHLALAALAAMAGLSASALTTPPLYYAEVDVLFLLPDESEDANEFLGDPALTLYLAGIVERSVNSGGAQPLTTFAPLYGTGIRHGHWVHIPNAGGQWQMSYDRPLITVEVVGESPDEVAQQLDVYAGQVADEARSAQEAMGIPAPLHIRTSASPELPQAVMIGMKRSRAEAGMLLLTVITVPVVVSAGDRLLTALQRRRSRGAAGEREDILERTSR